MGKTTFTLILVLLLGANPTLAGSLKGEIQGAAGTTAAVWLEGFSGQGFAVPRTPTIITHRGGHLWPYLSLGFVGSEFVLGNEDSRLHTTHLHLRLGYQKAVSERPLFYGADLYNVALPFSGWEVRKPIKAYHAYRADTGFIEIICNPHPEERAYALVFDHPFATLTDNAGGFVIDGIPPGRHPLRYWTQGEVIDGGVVEVREGEVATIVLPAKGRQP